MIGGALVGFVFSASLAFAEEGFTQKDREILVELRVKVEEVDKRFEQMDKRFAEFQSSVDKRFQQVDTRITELRQDMNKQFDQMFHFLYILSGIFTSLVVAVIGFAYWDRRTVIREARREAIEFMEKEGVLRRLIDALKELSREDARLAEALRRFHLM